MKTRGTKINDTNTEVLFRRCEHADFTKYKMR